mmetsp:Transcript_8906/g.24873  ORF Transcript_8906/g.24873 Transcript_8906/m.24873 type:complete len:502 (+) Transcript_8906:127-1632(+)|eukprot:scaffold70994_cov30-Tisochrysis_lutea.AAC.1
MGACGSKRRHHTLTKKEEEQVTSHRLHEFFGATVDVNVEESKAGLPDQEEADGTSTTIEAEPNDQEPLEPEASADAICHSYAALLGDGLAPAGTNMRLSHGALSAETTRLQRAELEEAAKLIQSMGATGADADIVATCDKDGCHYELSINWESAFVACATQHMTALPLSMIEICALVREPDLIPLPRWPGLPRLETVSIIHEFEPNNIVYHIGIEPWGPFPGVDSIAVAVAFVRPDGAIVGFARSPPEEDSKIHRGWNVLPPQKRRKRMQLDGCAWVITPRNDGKADVTIYMKTRIPIPNWLVPPSLVRWVTPKVFRRTLPLLTSEKTKEPFRQRVLEDKHGFYHILKQQLGLSAPHDEEDATAPRAEHYSLGVHKAQSQKALMEEDMALEFVRAIQAYDWVSAEKLATTEEQKEDLRDSILRVNAIELFTNRGEKDKALALAITEAEVDKINSYIAKPKPVTLGPNSFFDPMKERSNHVSPPGVAVEKLPIHGPTLVAAA